MKKALIFNNNTTTPQKNGCNRCFKWFLATFFTLCLLLFFSPSHAFKIDSDAIVRGGAIYVSNADVTIQGQDASEPLVLSYNTAHWRGGAIAASKGDSPILDQACINNLMPPELSLLDVYKEYFNFHNVYDAYEKMAADSYGMTLDEFINFMINEALNEGASTIELKMGLYSDMGVDFNHCTISSRAPLINFKNSIELINNTAMYGGALEFRGEINVNFDEDSIITATGNVAEDGGVMNFYDYEDSMAMVNFNGTITATGNEAYRGGALNFFGGFRVFFGGKMTFGGDAKEDGNISTSRGSGVVGGGALFIRGCIVSFTGDIKFLNNESGPGGAIAFYQGNKIVFGGYYDELGEIVNVDGHKLVAQNNTAVNSGGAMYFYEDSDTTVVNFNGEMILIDNEARGDGRAMYFNADYNKATMMVNFNTDSVITVNNNTTNVTSYDFYGGAMYFRSGSVETTVNFNGTIITTGNEAIRGGVMYFEDYNVLNFNADSVITANNNSATDDGGAMYFYHVNEVNFNGTFTANNNTADSGGAVCIRYANEVNLNGEMTLTGNGKDADGNVVTQIGGAMYFISVDEVNFNAGGVVTANNNSSYNYGGAVCINANEVNFNGTLYLGTSADNETKYGTSAYDTTLGNTAEDGGAMGFNRCDEVNFNKGSVITATGNTAEDGGAMGFYTISSSAMTVHFNGTFTANNNTADGGGAMYFYNVSSSSMTVNFGGKLTFSGNIAFNRGGAVYSYYDNSMVNFNKGSVITATGNKASSGGAIYLASKNTLNFNGTIIATGNTADSGGAMILANFNMVNFNKGSVITATGNTAEDGGAMYFNIIDEDNFNGEMTLTGNGKDADGNVVTQNGGAMYFYRCDEVNFNKGSVITANNNTAEDGGAMGFHRCDEVNFNTDSVITANNNTAEDGGAMYFYNFDYYMMEVNFNSSDIVFDGNTGTGSAIYAHSDRGRSYGGSTYNSYLDVIFHKSPKFINQTGYPIYAEAEIDHSNSNLTPADRAYVRIYNPPAVAGYVRAWKSRQNAPNAWAVVQKYDSLPTIVRDETTGLITSVTPVDDSLAWQVIHNGEGTSSSNATTARWTKKGKFVCINKTYGKCE